MAGPFRTMLETMSPTWLSREYGAKLVLGLMGYIADAMAEAATLALKSPWLLEDTSPNDAVDLQSAETKIIRYPGESIASHRARVQTPWGAWPFAGTKDGTGGTGEGLEGQLALLGYPNAFTLADYEWTPDSVVHWSRFWVFIPESDHAWITDGVWSDPGTWSDGGVWDISASAAEIRALRQLIRQWKAARDRCWQIIVQLSGGELWDWPEGVWSDPGTWGDGDEIVFLGAR
jgi:hypothetical protein